MALPPRVVLGTDHAGFKLKEAVKAHLISQKIDVLDEGTFSEESVDYPAIMRRACARALEIGSPAIIFGGSGNGEAIAANKVHSIRAAVGYNEEIARLARAHNDANVLSIGARFIDQELAFKMVDIFLATPFDGGRHEGRVKDLE